MFQICYVPFIYNAIEIGGVDLNHLAFADDIDSPARSNICVNEQPNRLIKRTFEQMLPED